MRSRPGSQPQLPAYVEFPVLHSTNNRTCTGEPLSREKSSSKAPTHTAHKLCSAREIPPPRRGLSRNLLCVPGKVALHVSDKKTGRASTTRSAFRARHGIREFHPSPSRDSHFPAQFHTPPEETKPRNNARESSSLESRCLYGVQNELKGTRWDRNKAPMGIIGASKKEASSGIPM